MPVKLVTGESRYPNTLFNRKPFPTVGNRVRRARSQIIINSSFYSRLNCAESLTSRVRVKPQKRMATSKARESTKDKLEILTAVKVSAICINNTNAILNAARSIDKSKIFFQNTLQLFDSSRMQQTPSLFQIQTYPAGAVCEKTSEVCWLTSCLYVTFEPNRIWR